MKTILLVALIVVSAFAKKDLIDQSSIIHTIKGTAAKWVSGHNKYFDGKSMEDVKRLMGALETPQEMKLAEKEIQPLEAIPTEFDSRTAWPSCQSIKEVRDQSNCGSCWAFGAVEAISDRICIQSGQKDQTRISAQNLLTCCGFSCGNGCNGGYLEAAWSYYKNTGLVSGWLYNTTNYCQSYTFAPCSHHVSGKYPNCTGELPTPKCVKSCDSRSNATYTSDVHHGSSVYSVARDVAKIQTEIMTNGPVEASFTVYADFLTYKSGVYHHVSGSALGGHAIKILGWGVESGTEYWLIANSWNEDWGNQGFFRIKRGSNESGIENSIVAGIPKLTQSLTVE
jgi:cathepsin B